MKKLVGFTAVVSLSIILMACDRQGSESNAPQAAASAPANSSEADFKTGLDLINQNASQAEVAKGAQLLLKASREGNLDAKVELAKLYQEGRGVPKNPGQGVNLLIDAASKGSASAAYDLGLRYETGQDVEKNAGEAINQYLKSATGGNANAMYKLGEAFEKGEGVKVNAGESQNWFRKAAAAGHADAVRRVQTTTTPAN